MFGDLKAAFIERIDGYAWMVPQSVRDKAKLKVLPSSMPSHA